MLKEFKEFAVKGNVVDMAVGIIIGSAFTTVVKSLVSDVLMPPLGVLLGGVDLSQFFIVIKEGTKAAAPYATLADAKAAGAVAISYGVFINNVVSFIIVAFATFLLVRSVHRLKRKEQPAAPAAPTTKECPECCSAIPIKATRCPCCTSLLPSE
ncbi:large-conductance mechanosensitive channel protein MscL [Gallaecimonas mangrovi]|uniref:large-conductance mechanosensitive channel protein MscL n=1 Tax=Gallaecimonas mangrovi TaxID=2291597 RepID=UPI000E209FA3|nr:large-conductance mechanosensitive channel protein MscL [Gallaecimonas mangrovi]